MTFGEIRFIGGNDCFVELLFRYKRAAVNMSDSE